MDVFAHESLSKFAFTDGQNITGNNDKYLRHFWEISSSTQGKGKKWVLVAKGGISRKWYGNVVEVIDWSDKSRSEYLHLPL
jgi:hypothetical protein